ncbi:MAG TPA: hypothetical protein VNX01_02870 [Bacteroidia bacterium]|jgi:hypothetical protein|nr:hypothetical protein [Bacteroidia bacterium]
MTKSKKLSNTLNSKGASILKKILDDKKAIYEHLQNGGQLSDLKNKYKFVKPIPII